MIVVPGVILPVLGKLDKEVIIEVALEVEFDGDVIDTLEARVVTRKKVIKNLNANLQSRKPRRN